MSHGVSARYLVEESLGLVPGPLAPVPDAPVPLLVPAPPPDGGVLVLAGAVLVPWVPEPLVVPAAPMLRLWVVVSVELVLLLAPVGLVDVLVRVVDVQPAANKAASATLSSAAGRIVD